MFPNKGWTNLSFHGHSIAAEAAWRFDADEIVEIEIDDGLQSVSRRCVAKTFRQGIVPAGVFGLQDKQCCDSVAPALRTCATVDRPSVLDYGHCIDGFGDGCAAGPIASLAFGVTERVLAFGLATSGHGVTSVT
jgi:hypothetical protein